jgi:transcriptional regulator
MYVPNHFRMTGAVEAFAFMAHHAFATLVSVHDGTPFATHLPFIVEAAHGDGSKPGRLRGHMARANPQWRGFGSAEVMVVFAGPHAYISPAWYEASESVPTWDYTAVHAYGVPHIIDDPAEVRTVLATLVERNERGFAAPWDMEMLSETYLSGMMKGIVAFDIPIARFDAKEKLSQNRPAIDQHRVAAMLARSSDPTDREVGVLIAGRLATQPL